ncbi:hypothetical protein NC651_020949 [Populus alba x Populus x berolinensis]|nr:hypothetical protein NC651_020949 [Populus alba x Populus x berolinensis]
MSRYPSYLYILSISDLIKSLVCILTGIFVILEVILLQPFGIFS